MKEQGSGIGKLTFWMMNGLLLIVLSLVGAWAWDVQGKIQTGEKERDGLREMVYRLNNKLDLLSYQVELGFKIQRCDVCRWNERFDDYRARHGEQPMRSPCAQPCP